MMRELIERILRDNLLRFNNTSDMIDVSSQEISDMIVYMLNQLDKNKNEYYERKGTE